MFEIFNETNETIDIKDIETLLNNTVKFLSIEEAIFNVIIVDDEKIHEINREYRNVDRPTDVISFALEDDKTMTSEVRILGDIYVSIDTARHQAYEYYNTEKEELRFLIIHGLLHLLGYDHMNESDEKEMMSLEEEVLCDYDPKRRDRKKEII